MADPRTPARESREAQTRVEQARPMAWRNPGSLPELPPNCRWVRIATKGQDDVQNFYNRQQVGYEPMLRSEYPELARKIIARKGSPWAENIEIGGLLACKRSPEMAAAEQAYLNDLNNQQVRSVYQQAGLRQEVPTARVEVSSSATVTDREGNTTAVNG